MDLDLGLEHRGLGDDWDTDDAVEPESELLVAASDAVEPDTRDGVDTLAVCVCAGLDPRPSQLIRVRNPIGSKQQPAAPLRLDFAMVYIVSL